MSGYEPTNYGFTWYAMQVTRIASVDRRGGKTTCIGIGKAADEDWRHEITIYVSPKGNSIRVFRRGVEMHPKPKVSK